MLAAVEGKVWGQSISEQRAAPEGRHNAFWETIRLRDAWKWRKGNKMEMLTPMISRFRTPLP